MYKQIKKCNLKKMQILSAHGNKAEATVNKQTELKEVYIFIQLYPQFSLFIYGY